MGTRRRTENDLDEARRLVELEQKNAQLKRNTEFLMWLLRQLAERGWDGAELARRLVPCHS
jgi:hypothetical protein